jgi:hypothetical protein
MTIAHLSGKLQYCVAILYQKPSFLRTGSYLHQEYPFVSISQTSLDMWFSQSIHGQKFFWLTLPARDSKRKRRSGFLLDSERENQKIAFAGFHLWLMTWKMGRLIGFFSWRGILYIPIVYEFRNSIFSQYTFVQNAGWYSSSFWRLSSHFKARVVRT